MIVKKNMKIVVNKTTPLQWPKKNVTPTQTGLPRAATDSLNVRNTPHVINMEIVKNQKISCFPMERDRNCNYY